MVSDGVLTVIVFYGDVLMLICRYALQGGASLNEQQSFYDVLNADWDMHSAGNLVICLGDFSGHVGRHIDGFAGVPGGYRLGQRYF